LYARIRQKLSRDLFNEFADIVNLFNEGRIEPSDAVIRIEAILGKGQLAGEMTQLILDAVRASNK
jgi:hypothetical protein